MVTVYDNFLPPAWDGVSIGSGPAPPSDEPPLCCAPSPGGGAWDVPPPAGALPVPEPPVVPPPVVPDDDHPGDSDLSNVSALHDASSATAKITQIKVENMRFMMIHSPQLLN